MAGIYIHIPFCRQRCYYCDFYTTTQLTKKSELVAALNTELISKAADLASDTVNTIYFGGGTPSLLSTDEINTLIKTIYNNYKLSNEPEITLEANPDDLSEKQLELLTKTPINRLSIGIQSFINDDLKLMNRRHDAQQAIQSVKQAQKLGFNNISIDLIYGLPKLSMQNWQYNLEVASELNVQHISAYHLTYEKGTVFDTWRTQKKISPITEDDSLAQFKELIKWAKTNHFTHYEISNFAKQEFLSQHNTSYWQQQKYLGIGPSAHSYNIDSRWWNIANLSTYIDAINNNKLAYDIEHLSETDKYNEFLITLLRTRWGIDLNKLQEQFTEEAKLLLLKNAQVFIDDGSLYIKDNHLILSDAGIFVSDAVLAKLMKVS